MSEAWPLFLGKVLPMHNFIQKLRNTLQGENAVEVLAR